MRLPFILVNSSNTGNGKFLNLAEGQQESIVEDIEMMVRSYVEKVRTMWKTAFPFLDFHSGKSQETFNKHL